MRANYPRAVAGLALVMLLAGCATTGPYDRDGSYPGYGTRDSSYGYAYRRSDGPGPSETAGTLIGGALGGVLGNQVGRGGGRAAATVGGVILGGVVGNAIGRSVDETNRQYDRYDYYDQDYRDYDRRYRPWGAPY
jgi:outer membrane lipoprotein SlyB